MFTLTNNVATFVVDRTGVTGSSGVYTITYDAELYKSTKKLLEEGYTVVFKVVLKNTTTHVNSKAEYFTAYLDDVGTKIYFLPDAELSSAGVFKFTLLDIPYQVKTNKSDIADIKTDITDIETDINDIKADIQDSDHEYTSLESRVTALALKQTEYVSQFKVASTDVRASKVYINYPANADPQTLYGIALVIQWNPGAGRIMVANLQPTPLTEGPVLQQLAGSAGTVVHDAENNRYTITPGGTTQICCILFCEMAHKDNINISFEIEPEV